MNAHGQLNHHFWGDYSCGIALSFASPAHAAGALELLPGFRQPDKAPHALIATLNSAQLEAFKVKLAQWGLHIDPCGRRDCPHQCRDADIDSCNHSIDYGPAFTVQVPADSTDQARFAFAAATPTP